MKVTSNNIFLLAGVALFLISFGTTNVEADNTSSAQTKSETKSTTQNNDQMLQLTPEKRLEIEEDTVDDQTPG